MSHTFKIRGTHLWYNFLSGPSAWNFEDYKTYLEHIATLGLNFVGFHVYTGGLGRYVTYVEPFIRPVYRNITPHAELDTSSTARWGYRPLSTSEFPYGISKYFSRTVYGSEVALKAKSNSERYKKAQELLKKVLYYAHSLGIKVGLGFEFGIHPPEFFSVAPGDTHFPRTTIPDPTHPAAVEILQIFIDDIIATYRELDYLGLWLHEHTTYVHCPQFHREEFRKVYNRIAPYFAYTKQPSHIFHGVWSTVYVRRALQYIRSKSSRIRVVVCGWGNNKILPLLQGLHKVLPKDVILSCLSPNMGLEDPPKILSGLKGRLVWAFMWLEGDRWLWHPQPRLRLISRQVSLARDYRLNGIVGVHWRTREAEPNLRAFASCCKRTNVDAEELAWDYTCSEYGNEASDYISRLLLQMESEKWFENALSPEYSSYDPSWGVLSYRVVNKIENACKDIISAIKKCKESPYRENLQDLLNELKFTLLLNEVSRKMGKVTEFKHKVLILPKARIASKKYNEAREILKYIPIRELLTTYARKVKTRGEMGVLSSLNQKLYLHYRDLVEFFN